MNDNYIRQRITQLRMQRGISEYKMSIDLGHSKGYIQSITSGRALPSMNEFLTICDYFAITPREFFCEEQEDLLLLKELQQEALKLDRNDILLLIEIAKRFNNN